jgi:hypothetical protein
LTTCAGADRLKRLETSDESTQGVSRWRTRLHESPRIALPSKDPIRPAAGRARQRRSHAGLRGARPSLPPATARLRATSASRGNLAGGRVAAGVSPGLASARARHRGQRRQILAVPDRAKHRASVTANGDHRLRTTDRIVGERRLAPRRTRAPNCGARRARGGGGTTRAAAGSHAAGGRRWPASR